MLPGPMSGGSRHLRQVSDWWSITLEIRADFGSLGEWEQWAAEPSHSFTGWRAKVFARRSFPTPLAVEVCEKEPKFMKKFVPRDRDPLFFLHIPKTAGSSMRLYLRNQYRKETICPITMNSWEDVKSIDVNELKTFQLVHGHFGFNLRELLYPEMKTLTILRHPFDLTISLIRHLQRDPDFHPLHSVARGCSIREIIGGQQFAFPFANIQTAFLSASVDPFRVYAFMKENSSVGENWNPTGLENGPDMDVAMRNLEKIDFVGLVERLDDFLPMVSNDMSYHPPTVFPRSNAAPGDRTDFHTLASDDIEAIEACNQLDLKLYGQL